MDEMDCCEAAAGLDSAAAFVGRPPAPLDLLAAGDLSLTGASAGALPLAPGLRGFGAMSPEPREQARLLQRRVRRSGEMSHLDV